MVFDKDTYPVSLKVDYPNRLDRLTSFFRILWVIPILIILVLLSGSSTADYTGKDDVNRPTISFEMQMDDVKKEVKAGGAGIVGGLFVATALMIVFRQRYPKWWFDFNLELNRFSTRVGAYLFLLTDKYPSTEDAQSIHLDIQYPDAKKDLNRWLPLVKWLLAVPHYIVLLFLVLVALFATIIAWFAILFTGRYPKELFDFVVGVMRWGMRVNAYAFLLTTDKYPQFSLK